MQFWYQNIVINDNWIVDVGVTFGACEIRFAKVHSL